MLCQQVGAAEPDNADDTAGQSLFGYDMEAPEPGSISASAALGVKKLET